MSRRQCRSSSILQHLRVVSKVTPSRKGITYGDLSSPTASAWLQVAAGSSPTASACRAVAAGTNAKRLTTLFCHCCRAVEFYDHLRDYEGMLEVSPDGEQQQSGD